MTALDEQLRRFHAAVTGAAPLASATALIEGGAVDAIARLRVYAHAYTSRIAGVLVADHPKLDTFVGSLRDLVVPYLRAYPPADPSLREVGQHLAAFLAERGDAAHVVELARLERARVEVFDGPDAPPLGRDEVAAIGVEEFPALSLRLIPSSRVLELATNADELWDAIEEGRAPPAAVRSPRTVLVWRRDVTVIHRTLDPDEAPVIRALVLGTSFAEACALLSEHLPEDLAPAERALALLVHWLDAEILRRDRS